MVGLSVRACTPANGARNANSTNSSSRNGKAIGAPRPLDVRLGAEVFAQALAQKEHVEAAVGGQVGEARVEDGADVARDVVEVVMDQPPLDVAGVPDKIAHVRRGLLGQVQGHQVGADDVADVLKGPQ